MKCPECNGKGKIVLFSSQEKCENCGGTGQVKEPSLTCPSYAGDFLSVESLPTQIMDSGRPGNCEAPLGSLWISTDLGEVWVFDGHEWVQSL
jgi:hypothetical protein